MNGFESWLFTQETPITVTRRSAREYFYTPPTPSDSESIVVSPEAQPPWPTNRWLRLLQGMDWYYDKVPGRNQPNIEAARRRVVDMTVRLNMRRSAIMTAQLPQERTAP